LSEYVLVKKEKGIKKSIFVIENEILEPVNNRSQENYNEEREIITNIYYKQKVKEAAILAKNRALILCYQHLLNRYV
jgi:hypothetical protein